MKVYLLTTISYEDDYKHRYDNGVYPDTIGIYLSEEKAKQKACEILYEQILHHINQYCKKIKRLEQYSWVVSDYDDDNNEGENEEVDNEKILQKYENDYDELQALASELFVGEFVDTTFELDIEEEEVIE